MKRRCAAVFRASLALYGAGILLQTGGCMVGTNEVLAGLTTSVVYNLISSLVSGAFNLTP